MQKVHKRRKMCQTIYPSRAGITNQNLIALTSINTISGLVNICINIFLVYGLWKLDLAKKVSYKFIVCLCIGDGCVGLVTQPALSVLLMTDHVENDCTHEITTHSLQVTFCQYSVLMVLIITMDRFLHMTYLTRYKTLMTQKRARILIVSSILITIAIVLLNMIGSIYEFHFPLHTAIITINTIIFIIIFIIYLKTYSAIRTRVHDSHFKIRAQPVIRTGSTAPRKETKDTSKSKIQYHHNFGKAMVFVLLTLAICYLPYFLLITHISYLKYQNDEFVQDGDWKTVCLYWLMQLAFLNPTANAVIVIVSCKQLRRFAKNCFKTTAMPA